MNKRWRNFLLEETEISKLKRYEATFSISIASDITEALLHIRAIPNVTTVYKTGKARELQGFTSINLVNVKFILEPHENSYTYLNHVLKPKMLEVEGLHIINFKGLEELD